MTENLTVVGGGITGLAIAYIAAKNGRKVKIIEAGSTFGGLLNTFEIGGTRLEFYYHHFFTHDAELMWLLRELDLQKELIFHGSTMGVFRNGKIYDFNSPADLLKFSPISMLDKLRFGMSSLYLGKVAKWQQYEHVSAMEWLKKWAGDGTTANLWKPLLDVKFGPYANEVPLAWMIGRLRQRMSSRKNNDEKLGYLKGSLQKLLDALLLALKNMGVELIKDAPVTELTIKDSKLKSIKTPKGMFEGDDFIFTIPTVYLSNLLKGNAPELAAGLEKIEYFGAVCTILELNQKLSDIYWLNVADPGFPFGGVIEHTNLIAPSAYNGSHIVYLSRYFSKHEPIAKMSEEEIKATMLKPLKLIYPSFSDDQIKNVYVFKTNTAATVCDLNFSKKVPQSKTSINNLYIASMPHIYPDERSTNNSIRVAAQICAELGIKSSFVPVGSSLSGQIGFNV